MRLVRTAVAAAAGLSLVVVGTSGAATKPVCNLVTDAGGDATGAPVTGTPGVTPNGAAYDITSLDVANDKANFTGVIRVTTLSKTSSNAPTGLHWTVGFAVAGETYQLSAHNDPAGGETYELDSVDVPNNSYSMLSEATGVLDIAKNEVRISVPVSAIPTKVTSGSKITDITGTTGAYYSVPLVVSAEDGTDTAAGGSSYVAGAKSCVTPGK